MFSPIHRTSRRQFLDRSAWGFGGAFLLPSLLASCTDHLIPPTDPNLGPTPTLPPTEDVNIDYNDTAKLVVVTGLNLVPQVGGFVSGLVDVLWPSSRVDVWGQVKDQVENLIDKKISTDVWNRLTGQLQGLKNLIVKYQNAILDQSDIKTHWIVLTNAFAQALPSFQQKDQEVLLLPLYTQVVNLYLSVLRDPLYKKLTPGYAGRDWGMSDAALDRAAAYLSECIRDATSYTTTTYQAGRDKTLKNTPQGLPQASATNEPFTSINTYDRGMTLTVLDYMDAWPYFDNIKYPNGTENQNDLMPREIYSDPYGNTFAIDPYIRLSSTFPTSGATQFPTQLTVWGGSRIDAVQLTYPAGGGPNGVTQTPRMGDMPDSWGKNGGSNQPPHGGMFTIYPTNPITQAYITYEPEIKGSKGLVLNTVQFMFNDRTLTHKLGTNEGVTKSGWVGYTYRALSSIYCKGESARLGNTATCMVLGFKQWNSPAATLRALQTFYVSSPQEYRVADFTKTFPTLGITDGFIDNTLREARQAYWERIKAQVPK